MLGPVDGPGWSWWRGAAGAVVRRPDLWSVAVRQGVRLAPLGWWRRRPFLPLPDPAYLRFRLETQYGSDQQPSAHDVVTYLHWCKTFEAGRTR